MKNIKRYISSYWIFPILIILATVFMAIGYASVFSTTSEIQGTLLASVQEGIFITDMVYSSDNNAYPNGSGIISLNETLVESKIQLGNNKDSSITYTITVYNNSDINYYFKETIHEEGSKFYDNTDIVYSLDGIKKGDLVPPSNKDGVSFNITFKYKDGLTQIDNTILNSFIKFVFVPADDVNRITLAYNGKETVELLPNATTEGTFSDIAIDSGTVIRCNNGAIPTFNNNRIGYTNVTNDTTCQVYDSLKEAIDSSDTSVNNYLWIANENATQEIIIPAEKTAHVDINGKNINYVAGSDIEYLEVFGELKLKDSLNTGRIKVDYRFIKAKGKVVIESGNYVREGTSEAGGLVGNREGTVYISNSKFTTDNTWAVFASGTGTTLTHVDNCTITSKNGQAVANTGANSIISIANSTITSETTNYAVRLSQNKGTYICNSTLNSKSMDFYNIDANARAYYTSNVTFVSKNNTPTTSGSGSVIKNYTKSTEVDWYIAKDLNNNILKHADGSNIRVGEKFAIISKGTGTFACNIANSNFTSGANIEINTYSTTNTAQQFMLLASADNNYYNIASYGYPTLYFNIAGGTGANFENIRLYNGTDVKNERFSMLPNGDNYYVFKSQYGTAIDLANGTQAAGINIRSYQFNGSSAQSWKLNKL